MIELTKEDVEIILYEKPYDIDTAILYADKMSKRYGKMYCVIKDNKNRKLRNYHIVGIKYFSDNISIFELYYISGLKH